MVDVAVDSDQPQPPREGSKRATGVEPHLRWLAERQRHFSSLFDFTSGKGLEIGPLDTAAVNRRTSDVAYVDVYDLAGTVEKYKDDHNVLLQLIPESTYSLWDGERIRSLAEAAAPGAPFEWVVASHVVEHVPNLVVWLADIARITSPAGALVLAVPDRRFTFDCHRPPTTVGQVIEAYLRGDTRPGPRAVYDSRSASVPVDASTGLNRGARPPGRSSRGGNPLDAFEYAKRASEEYLDTHVWIFSAQEFVELIKELREIGLSEWYVETLAGDQRSPEFEFLVVLRKVPGTGESFAEVGFESDLPGFLADQWQWRDKVQHLSNQLAHTVNMLKKIAGVLSDQQPPE